MEVDARGQAHIWRIDARTRCAAMVGYRSPDPLASVPTKSAGVDDKMAKRAAAEVGIVKEPTQEIKERLGRIETALTDMRSTPGITATGSLATAAGVFALASAAVVT